jgi:hypothetical protein
MKVTITRTRMAMPGRFYAYDGMVSTDQLDRSKHDYFVVHDRVEHVRFDNATRPPELEAMEKGWPRYQAVLAHEKAAKAVLLELAKQAYPELASATVWPELWVEIPEFEGRHDSRTVEYSPAPQGWDHVTA